MTFLPLFLLCLIGFSLYPGHFQKYYGAFLAVQFVFLLGLVYVPLKKPLKTKNHSIALIGFSFLSAPVLALCLHWFGSSYVQVWQKIVLLLTVGILWGMSGMAVAHELLHSKSKLEKWSARFLLNLFAYSYWIDAHWLHHKYLSTNKDPHSAKDKQSIYSFFMASLYHEVKLVCTERPRKFALSLTASSLTAISIYMIFGIQALLWWLALSILVIFYIAFANYLEHFGLFNNHHPRVLAAHHSWSTRCLFTNVLMLNIGYHQMHHELPTVPHNQLDNKDQQIELPGSYIFCGILALIPPLWFYVMNKSFQKYEIKP